MAVCQQTNRLAKQLNMPLSTISAEKVGEYTLITVYFIADGQQQYYIIAPDDSVINTLVDPRKVSKSLAKRYKNADFMLVNWDAPKYQAGANGQSSFVSQVRVTKTCLACEVIGFAKIKFDFSAQGHLSNVSLVSFGERNIPGGTEK